MCSCAFYPLHLVYSGLIWTFGVRVNYISYKLFLHFLHSHVLNLRVLSFGKTLARNRVWPLEIKSNEILRSPRSRNINFSPIDSSNTGTPHDTRLIRSCYSYARIFCDSWQSLAYHKERNVLHKLIFSANLFEFFNICGHFFFLPFIIYCSLWLQNRHTVI